MGSNKMFRKWIWWKGGQYETMDMLRWGQHRAMDMMEKGEGSIKMFRQSGHTTVIFSCSWLAIYCHTRQLFESLFSLKITFGLDEGLKWQAADVRTTSLWLNWLCRYFALLIPVFCAPGSCVLCSVCVSLIGFVDSQQTRAVLRFFVSARQYIFC